MKTNKSRVVPCEHCEVAHISPQEAGSKDRRYQHWLAKISDKLGLCCAGLHK